MKKITMIFSILILMSTFIISTNKNVYAASTSMSQIITDAQGFVSGDVDSKKAHIYVTPENLQSTSKIINNVLLAVAIGVAFVVITLLGINIMVQSAEEKAKVKEALVPFSIGALIAFGAFGIWNIVVKIFMNF